MVLLSLFNGKYGGSGSGAFDNDRFALYGNSNVTAFISDFGVFAVSDNEALFILGEASDGKEFGLVPVLFGFRNAYNCSSFFLAFDSLCYEFIQHFTVAVTAFAHKYRHRAFRGEAGDSGNSS